MKILYVYLLVSISFFLACSSAKDLKIIKDGVNEEYLKENYYVKKNSKWKFFSTSSIVQDNLDHFKNSLRRQIIEDIKMPEAKQVEHIKRIESFIYEKNRYFLFRINSTAPLLEEYKKINFFIKDKNNENYIADHFFLEYKYSNYGYALWESYGYAYVWIFKSSKPITKKDIEQKVWPVNLIVIFPNGTERHYSILD